MIRERFDCTEMAKCSLGPECQRRTPEERQKLVQLFTDLLERAYMATAEDVSPVDYLGERVDGNDAK